MAWPLDLFNPAPSPDEVQRQLRRILESPEFARTTRLKALLAFIVGCALDGKVDRLSGHVIAAEVFQRGESFDPETDSIVRTEAARLRGRLEEYYRHHGRRDRVRILLNRRDYLPVFVMREAGTFSRLTDAIASHWRWVAAGAVAALATLAFYVLF